MQLPSDFGLTELQTLIHVGDGRRASCHAAYWAAWDEDLAGLHPTLVPRDASRVDPFDSTADVEFESVGHIPIGARLLLPDGPIKAGLVTTHGYAQPRPLAADAERWRPLVEKGVAVLAIRVRGYPGSAERTGLLIEQPEGWIAQGLQSEQSEEDTRASTWILATAVADVALACRALKHYLRTSKRADVPIALHGESFGGGLATLAAARLAEERIIHRLVVGLPTLGDWPWRLAHDTREGSGGGVGDHLGIGGEIATLLRRVGPDADAVIRTLRLFDTAIHARRIQCPTLCKLALRDDVVPAPTAAAIYNTLGTSATLKWRFVVPFGHFDGGLANARRHALFERVARDFLDPAHAVAEAMGHWSEELDPAQRPALAREAAEWQER